MKRKKKRGEKEREEKKKSVTLASLLEAKETRIVWDNKKIYMKRTIELK